MFEKLQGKFFIVHILLVVMLLQFCLCLQLKAISLVVLKVSVLNLREVRLI